MTEEEPHAGEVAETASCAAHRSDLLLAQLWMEVLQIDHKPAETDNFFEIGGDSMAMLMLEAMIGEELRIQVPAGLILAAPTFSELSAAILEIPTTGTNQADNRGMST